MTIKGIWDLVRPLLRRVNLHTHCHGRRAAIDASVWLHNFASTASVQYMVHGKTTNIIKKFRARLQKLLDEGVTPVFVFDGKAMPAKQSTNEGRTRERKQSMDTCLAYLRNGDLENAKKQAKRAIRITRSLVYEVIHSILRPMGITYIVAPYEADAMLAYLAHTGYVDAVVSVDGDMIVHGYVPQILYS